MLATPPYRLLVYFLLTAFSSVGESDFSARTARATGLMSSSQYCAYLRRVGLHAFRPTVLRAIKTAAAASWLGR